MTPDLLELRRYCDFHWMAYRFLRVLYFCVTINVNKEVRLKLFDSFSLKTSSIFTDCRYFLLFTWFYAGMIPLLLIVVTHLINWSLLFLVMKCSPIWLQISTYSPHKNVIEMWSFGVYYL